MSDEWTGVLDLSLVEARYLRFMLEGEHKTSDEVRARRLIVRIIDAIFNLERPYSEDSFPLQVKEPDLWLLDIFVKEPAKEPWGGTSLQPLTRKLWRLLHEVPQYAADFLEAPETGPVADKGDFTYKQAADRQKDNSDADLDARTPWDSNPHYT
jgi:hypothetical protein